MLNVTLREGPTLGTTKDFVSFIINFAGLRDV